MPSADHKVPQPLPYDEKTGFAVVALHNYPEYTDQCCRLLNLEWPRSRGARMNSLWSCNRMFPVALILINGELQQVLGHCKLSKVPTEPTACFIESVVIHPNYRGKGIGTYLMQKVEHYVCSFLSWLVPGLAHGGFSAYGLRKLSILYLSTMGQEKFYQKLGYEECGPVSLYGFGYKPGFKSEHSTPQNSPESHPNGHQAAPSPTAEKPKNGNSHSSSGPAHKPCPPPPPPPPSKLLAQEVMIKKTFMKKVLPSQCNHIHKSTSSV